MRAELQLGLEIGVPRRMVPFLSAKSRIAWYLFLMIRFLNGPRTDCTVYYRVPPSLRRYSVVGNRRRRRSRQSVAKVQPSLS